MQASHTHRARPKQSPDRQTGKPLYENGHVDVLLVTASTFMYSKKQNLNAQPGRNLHPQA